MTQVVCWIHRVSDGMSQNNLNYYTADDAIQFISGDDKNNQSSHVSDLHAS